MSGQALMLLPCEQCVIVGLLHDGFLQPQESFHASFAVHHRHGDVEDSKKAARQSELAVTCDITNNAEICLGTCWGKKACKSAGIRKKIVGPDISIGTIRTTQYPQPGSSCAWKPKTFFAQHCCAPTPALPKPPY